MTATTLTRWHGSKRSHDTEIDVVDWLRKLPKCELHLHLEGTIQPETLLELSRRHDAEPLTPEAAKKLYVYENFLGFLDSFKAVSARLKGPDDYELITYNMIRDLAAQGVVHAEVYVSFGIIYYWKKAEVEPFVEAIERGRVRGERGFWDDGVLADRCGAALWRGGGGEGVSQGGGAADGVSEHCGDRDRRR